MKTEDQIKFILNALWNRSVDTSLPVTTRQGAMERAVALQWCLQDSDCMYLGTMLQ